MDEQRLRDAGLTEEEISRLREQRGDEPGPVEEQDVSAAETQAQVTGDPYAPPGSGPVEPREQREDVPLAEPVFGGAGPAVASGDFDTWKVGAEDRLDAIEAYLGGGFLTFLQSRQIEADTDAQIVGLEGPERAQAVGAVHPSAAPVQ